MNVLTATELSLCYRTREANAVRAVDRVSFELAQGEVLGIAGESGCGKSTLVSGLLGLCIAPLEHESGSVSIDGQQITGMSPAVVRRDVLGTKVALIPQGALNALNPTARIASVAAHILRSHGRKLDGHAVREQLAARFDLIGLPASAMRAYPCELSGGMKQRAVIALSTLLDPRVVIADEPTSALDVSTQKTVVRLLLGLLKTGVAGSMVFVTHELPLLYHVADRIAVMYAGQIVELGAAQQIIEEPKHPYTQALMRSMLLAEAGTRSDTRTALPGAPPDLSLVNSGCRFEPRCDRAVAGVCDREEPQLVTMGARKVRCPYAG